MNTQAALKLFIDFSCIPYKEENHINELQSIVILASELMLSPLNVQTKVCKKYNDIAMNAIFNGSPPQDSTNISNLPIVSLVLNFKTSTPDT